MTTDKTDHQSVIMIMLDTLMDKPLQLALKEENMPALSYFMEYGNYYPNVVTPFPAMSVNVESTLLTGKYCDEHRIPALVWYSQNQNRIINHGTHVFELMKLGLTRSLYDIFYHLNQSYLNPDTKTIHEELHELGKESASINTLMHRGSIENTMTIPPLVRFFVAIEKNLHVKTPSTFVYGRLAGFSSNKKYSHLWNNLGFNNNYSVQEFSELVKNHQLPQFSIVYLPDHDKNVHKHGPMDIKGIKEMDQQLQTILDTFESWEQALENHIWILIGDNGQSRITNNKETASVDLRKLLQPFKITKLRKGVRKEDDIVLAINLRSCFIYSLNTNEVPISAIVEKLQSDDRIEIIAWKSDDWYFVTSSGTDETFKFKPNGDFKDIYNQTWKIDGDESILDLKVEGQGIDYGDFPDALKRLHSSLTSHEGDFVVTTVKPDYQFIGESTPTHVGGASHGGIHANDTNIPMIVTGTNSTPKYLRMVDMKEWILQLTADEDEISLM